KAEASACSTTPSATTAGNRRKSRSSRAVTGQSTVAIAISATAASDSHRAGLPHLSARDRFSFSGVLLRPCLHAAPRRAVPRGSVTSRLRSAESVKPALHLHEQGHVAGCFDLPSHKGSHWVHFA